MILEFELMSFFSFLFTGARLIWIVLRTCLIAPGPFSSLWEVLRTGWEEAER